MKKVIALLMALCFMAMALVACGNNNEKPTESRPTATLAPTDEYGQELFESVVDWTTLDFEGENISVLLRETKEYAREFGLEDPGDDMLDLAIATRNEKVASDLNIEVILNHENGPGGYDALRDHYIDLVTNDIVNDIHNYDVVAHFAYVAPQMSIRDFNANLLDKDTFPYFDFQLPCWNQTLVDNTAVNGKLFFVAGDMNISMFNLSMIIWHNLDLYETVKTESDPDNIQDLAIAGEWTYAELYRWSTYYEDADPTGACADIYGVYMGGGKTGMPNPLDAIPYAWDLELVTTEADGSHKFNCVGNQKAEEAMKRFNELFANAGNSYYAFNHGSQKCTCGKGVKAHFVNGDVLFSAEPLYASEGENLAIRNMQDRYALLPHPKYDETQDHYATTSQDAYTLMVVLDHSQSTVPTKGKAVSAYLQYSTEYSYTNVRGYYFERIVKPSYFGTDDSDGHVSKSIAIFNTIIDNLGFDFWTVYSPLLNDSVHLFRDALGLNLTLQSEYLAAKDKFDAAIFETDKWLGIVN